MSNWNDPFANFIHRASSHDHYHSSLSYNAPSLPISSLSSQQLQVLTEKFNLNSEIIRSANICSLAPQSVRTTLFIPLMATSFPTIQQNKQVCPHLQTMINQSMYIFYKSDGAVNISLSAEDQQRLAYSVINYLKATAPDYWESIIRKFISQHRPGFLEAYKDSSWWSKSSSWKISEGYPQDPKEMKQRIDARIQNLDLKVVDQACSEFRFSEALTIVNDYRDNVMYNSATPADDYATMNKLYSEHLEAFCLEKIFKPLNICPNKEMMALLHEAIPLGMHKPMEMVEFLVSTLIENQHNDAYHRAASPLWDDRGLPRFYNYNIKAFQGIAIPISIASPEHMQERILLLKIAVLATHTKETDLRAHRTAVSYVARSMQTT